jgi:predicted Zn-dependent protease with MMP-like domain
MAHDQDYETLRRSRMAFQAVVDEVVDSLPEWVVDRIDNLTIEVAEWPTVDQDPGGAGMLGLYEGVSLLERGNEYYGAVPDTITIFRQPHVDRTTSGAEVRAEVRRTVLHELAHHLGIDDRRLAELGWD